MQFLTRMREMMSSDKTSSTPLDSLAVFRMTTTERDVLQLEEVETLVALTEGDRVRFQQQCPLYNAIIIYKKRWHTLKESKEGSEVDVVNVPCEQSDTGPGR